ncbi:MAG: ABC transporter ATP-binding protein [Candidatus Brocadiia bacterium]
MDSLMTLKDIRLDYGRFRLDVPELEIIKGQRLCLIGANGAGKSTLLKIIGLLESPGQGRIYLNGNELSSGEMPKLRGRITLVFNEPVLYRGTAKDNLMVGLNLRRVSGKESAERIDEALAMFGISHLKEQPAKTLSSGEKQRLNLARALVIKPELLLLDEPSLSLDAPTREKLFYDLQQVLDNLKITTVLVTQLRDEALGFAQRLGVILDGKIIQTGLPQEIFNSPVNQQVAEFVGMNTVIDGKIESTSDGVSLVKVKGNNIIRVQCAQPIKQSEDVILGIRPEEVLLMAQDMDSHQLSARNKFRAKVIQVTPKEGQYKVSIECSDSSNQEGFMLNSLVTSSALKDLGIESGKIVIAVFKANAVHIIRR